MTRVGEARLELWTNVALGGGVRECFLKDAVGQSTESIDGVERFGFTLPAQSRGALTLATNKVIRAWETDAKYREWPVTVIGKKLDLAGPRLEIQCQPLLYRLRDLDPVRDWEVEPLNGVPQLAFGVSGEFGALLDKFVTSNPDVLARMPYLALGTIDAYDVVIDMQVDHFSPLKFVRTAIDVLADKGIIAELPTLRLSGSKYLLDVPQTIAGTQPKVSLVIGRNLKSVEITEDPTDRMTRAEPILGTIGDEATYIGRSRWRVVSANSGTKSLELEDPAGAAPPVLADGQLVTWYAYRERTAETLKIDGSVAGTTTSTFTLHDWTAGAAIVAGEYFQFRTTPGGTRRTPYSYRMTFGNPNVKAPVVDMEVTALAGSKLTIRDGWGLGAGAPVPNPISVSGRHIGDLARLSTFLGIDEITGFSAAGGIYKYSVADASLYQVGDWIRRTAVDVYNNTPYYSDIGLILSPAFSAAMTIVAVDTSADTITVVSRDGGTTLNRVLYDDASFGSSYNKFRAYRPVTGFKSVTETDGSAHTITLDNATGFSIVSSSGAVELFALSSTSSGGIPYYLDHPVYAADLSPGIGIKYGAIPREQFVAVANLVENGVYSTWTDETKLPDGWKFYSGLGDTISGTGTDNPVADFPGSMSFAKTTDPSLLEPGRTAALYAKITFGHLVSPVIPWTIAFPGQAMSVLSRFMPTTDSKSTAYLTMRIGIKLADGSIIPWYDPTTSTRSETTLNPNPRPSPPFGRMGVDIYNSLILNGFDISAPSTYAVNLRPNQADLDALGDAQGLVVIWTPGDAPIAGYFGGVTLTESSTAVAELTEFGDATKAWQSTNAALALLAPPQATYAVDLVDLKRANPDLLEADLMLGGRVLVSARDLGLLNVEQRIVEIVRNYGKSTETKVILSSLARRLTQMILRAQSQQERGISKTIAGIQSQVTQVIPKSGGTGTGTATLSIALSASMDASTHVSSARATVSADIRKVYFAVSTDDFPDADAVLAESPDDSTPFELIGPVLDPGQTAYFSAIGEDVNGNKTPLAPKSVTRPFVTFGAHAYWRFRNQNFGSTIQFTAMRFRNEAGDEVTPTGGTPICSGTSAGAIANLFDGNNATGWTSDAVGSFAWCGYHFATPVSIMQIALQRGTGYSTPTNGRFEYSDDGNVWKDVAFVDVGTLTVDTPKWFNFNNALPGDSNFGSHTHWRLFAPNTGGAGLSLAALLFKDDAGSSIPTTGGTPFGTYGDGAHPPAHAFDGVNGTWWTSDFFSNTYFAFQHVGYQFATPQTVMQIAVQRTASQTNPLPDFVAFQFSDDGETWGSACWANPSNSIAADTPDWFNFANAIPTNNGTDFGAHAYWKVQSFMGPYFCVFGNCVIVGWQALAEVVFKDASGAAISTAGATAQDSGSSGGNVAANAFDGNVSTLWEALNGGVSNPWIGMHWPTPVTVMQVGLERNASQDGSNHENEPQEVMFMCSDTGKEWIHVARAVTAPMTNSVLKTFDLAGAL